ncbi:PhnD/SsuA/transferrin family substrate-binding protein [Bacteroidota bacterium]
MQKFFYSFIPALIILLSNPIFSSAQKIRIATDLWSGSGILYLAEQKGFFKEEGLDIELIYYDDYHNSINAFMNGEVDGHQEAISDAIFTALKGKKYIGLFSPANNKGFDQLIANENVYSIADLKGKKIAYAKGTVGHFLVLKALNSAGMIEEDIIHIEANFNDAKEKFENNEVDAAAAIFFDIPKNSHTIYSTADYPLPNVFIFDNELVEKNSSQFIRFVKVWQKTVEYFKENFQESIRIMTKSLKIDDHQFTESLVYKAPILDLNQNINTFYGENAEIKHLVYEIVPFLQQYGDLSEEEYRNSKLFLENLDNYINDFFLNITGYSINKTVDTLIFGIINHKGYESVYRTYKPMTKYICQQLSNKLSSKIVDSLVIFDYRELRYPLQNNEVDIGIFNPYSYIDATRDFPEFEVFAFHTLDGDSTYKGVIAVRESSNINNLYDLKGKKFLFVDSNSTSGFKYPSKFFDELSIPTDSTFFASIGFSGSHDKSIISFTKNEVDGIATYERAFEDSLLIERYSIDTVKRRFIREVDIPHNAYVFCPSINNLYKKYIKETMFEAHINPKTSEMFYNSVKINSWKQCGDDIFNPLRNIFQVQRIKPKILFSLSMNKSLPSEDRITLEITEKQINSKLRESNRFNTDYIDFDNNSFKHELELTLSKPKSNTYQYLLSLDNKGIARGNLSSEEFQNDLPNLVLQKCLNNLDIKAKLFYDKKNGYWLIKYGLKDGIDNTNYNFIFLGEKNQAIKLSKKDIIKVKDYYTIIRSRPEFEENYKILIKYHPEQNDKNVKPQKFLAYFFATDNYDDKESYDHLNNPVKDARSLADILHNKYGFDTTLVFNAELERIETVLEKSINCEYNENDQLFIFFAGHGYFKKITQKGYIVAKDSYGTSNSNYLSYSYLSDILSKHPCKHIFLVIDVCFSGTFFENIAAPSRGSNEKSRGVATLNTEKAQSHFVNESLKHISRIALTASGNDVVSDGTVHSPFAFKLLELLRTTPKGEILTISSLKNAVQKVPPFPKMAGFGNNEPGSDFLLISQ